MFTGIIEEIGVVKSFEKSSIGALITIECSKVLEDTEIGDSISISGVCQTVVKIGQNYFTADVSEETLNVTNFMKLKKGAKVNLERALAMNSRFGGHIVSGHVDGTAIIKTIEKWSSFYDLKFQLKGDNLERYVVRKGSITVNGISLTVADTYKKEFTVAIIPHTFENTNLLNLKVGDIVNIETDVFAKYVEKILSTDNNKSEISEKFLKENGFY
ncbi:riboflavin synthase [bacterium]|nr:riboflavin synthase [bacterium]